MKKLFTSFLTACAVSSFAVCAKKTAKPSADKKTEFKTETDSAETEEDSAETEEDSAETEEDSAETEEDSAETEEDSAETEEDSAETEEDSAETEEDSAETEEDSAETEEDSAETEEDSAETEEDSAETEEDSAETEEDSTEIEVELTDKVTVSEEPEPPQTELTKTEAYSTETEEATTEIEEDSIETEEDSAETEVELTETRTASEETEPLQIESTETEAYSTEIEEDSAETEVELTETRTASEETEPLQIESTETEAYSTEIEEDSTEIEVELAETRTVSEEPEPQQIELTEIEVELTKKLANSFPKRNPPGSIFTVGYVGSNTEYTRALKYALKPYTQDVDDNSDSGSEFSNIPTGLFLKSSDKYNLYIREDSEYISNWEELKTWLKNHVVFLDSDANDGGVTTEGNKYATYGGATAGDLTKTTAILGLVGATQDTLATTTDFDRVFSDDVIIKIFEALETNTPRQAELKTALETAGVKTGESVEFDSITATSDNINGTNMIYFNSGLNLANKDWYKTSSKTWATLQEDFKNQVIKSLINKKKLASKKIDALFIHVTRGVENRLSVYKKVVENKLFKATKLFFIGEKAKSPNNKPSKEFAGENVSTASFNKYAAAYIAGFQAAVGAIKFSGSEDAYKETSVAFLIGSTSESSYKKKAFAFRRGVEAAADHQSYSNYLKVKFVSKTEDSSESAKKLYRDISEWKAKDDSQSKLYEFASSDTFLDADRRVVYIAGATARDWSGYNTSEGLSLAGHLNRFKIGDDIGLVGALYNYGDLTNWKESVWDLTAKTYPKGVWVVLDEATAGTAANDDAVINDNEHSLSYVRDASKGQINLERHDVKFYGSIGTEIEGTKAYAKAALKGLYMGGPSYMIGKHTIFGAGLDLTYVTKSDDAEATVWTKYENSEYSSMWANSGGNDTTVKAEDRFKDSFIHATENEITEAELVESSPWL